MTLPWFRFYHEFATDPRVQMLSEEMQRRLVMLFCLEASGENEKTSLQEKAFFMRLDDVTLHVTLQVFQEKGFCDENGRILNWQKRQFASDSSAARVKKHREKTRALKECNGDVTLQKRKCNALDTDSEEDIEKKDNSLRSLPKENPEEKKPSGRGTRLSPDWKLPTEWGQWAVGLGMTREAVIREQDKFRDFWVAKTGANATKADWQATWRNWIRKHLEG